MKLLLAFFFVLTLSVSPINILAQGQTYAIKADRLIDAKSGQELLNPIILIRGNTIVDVSFSQSIPDTVSIVDLTGHTILPGLIDVHTHLMNDGGDYKENLYNNSPAFRALRAVSHLEISLNNGFTTIRDVCTEGAGYADVDLQKALKKGYIDGPRLIPSTVGIAATGQYYPSPISENWEMEFPSGTKYVTGVDESRKAVREQISKGAKWIKVFADWGRVTLTPDELSVIVEEASKYNVQVAAHATSKKGIRQAIEAGAKSIEHGDEFDEELIRLGIDAGLYWCPTMTVYEYFKVPSKTKYDNLRKAYEMGLKIVLGTDLGSCSWTEVNQALELEHYVDKIGMKPIDAIRSGTYLAAELLGLENEIGHIEKSYRADIIAVHGNPLEDITLLQNVDFVMKDGRIYKEP